MPPPRLAFKNKAHAEQSLGDDEKKEEEALTLIKEAEDPREKREESGGPAREKRKQREYEVFIGGLDRETTERDLVKVFREVGEVVEVRLVRRSFSPKSKGFAFVRFATVEQARRAATELRFVQVRGRSCGVTRSNNHETLHLGNICTSWTKYDLVQKLNRFELENLEEVHLMDDPMNKGKNRGYAFLDFSTHMDALAACCKLQKEEIFLGTDVRADIAFSRSVEPDDEIMSKVRSVFLDGLPATWDEEHVRLHFGKFGEIENVQLASNMTTAKRKDFGFISFKTREAALDCIEKINENGLCERNEKVLVKATLKKPLPRRFTPTGGFKRDYIGKDLARSRLQQPYEEVHSYSSRATRVHEPISRQYNVRMRELNPDSSREAGYSYVLSPTREKYEGQRRRRSIRELHEVAHTSNRLSRGEYYEGSSSSKLALERYRDIPPSYKQLPRSYSYVDDGDDEVYYVYEDEYSPYESRDFDYYDHPTYAGQKRRCSDIDDDMVVMNSLLRRNRSRSDYELDGYIPREVSKYDRYSRILPEDHVFDRVEYTSSDYGARYLSPREASRSYR